MKHVLLAVLLATPSQGAADGFVLGAGRWSCAEVIRVYETGTPSQTGQMAGWLLGYWSAATFSKGTAFVDIVEATGGRKIFEASVAECRKVAPDTPLFRVTRSMIRNTG